eukprot:gene6088-8390_t
MASSFQYSPDFFDWLKRYNYDVYKKYDKIEKEKELNEIMRSAIRDKVNSDTFIESVVNFTQPEETWKPQHLHVDNQNTEIIPKITDPENGDAIPTTTVIADSNGSVAHNNNHLKSSIALETLFLEDNKNTQYYKRFKAGMNPITLLTEKKRKIILNALSDINYTSNDDSRNNSKNNKGGKKGIISESKEISMEKVNDQLMNKYSWHDLVSNEHHNNHTISKNKLAPLPNRSIHTQNIDRKFRPSWDHYDTMRSRWLYVQPQIKHLVGDVDIIAPKTSQKYLQVNDNNLSANYVDASNFEKTRSKRITREDKIALQTVELKRLKDEYERSKIYKPQFAVRYK